MRPRISIRGSFRPSVGPSVCPSVGPSVRNAFVSNPRKRLFLTAEMDANKLVVMRGYEREAVARMGDKGGRW